MQEKGANWHSFANFRATCKLFRTNTPYFRDGKIIVVDEIGSKSFIEPLFSMSAAAINKFQFYPGFIQPVRHKLVTSADVFEMAVNHKTKKLKAEPTIIYLQ